MNLTINEIFYSIQGESTLAGLPCVFVRLTGCDLRCSYCDTAYAFYEGEKMELGQIINQVESYGCNLVEVTGGEPLLQKNVHPLMESLCDKGLRVLLETSGGRDISGVDNRVERIMDIKCPSSGEHQRHRPENCSHLTDRDEVKFVIGSREDYDWAKGQMQEGDWAKKVRAILFSPVFGKIELRNIAEWMMEDKLPFPVRMQSQLHKSIWEPNKRGV